MKDHQQEAERLAMECAKNHYRQCHDESDCSKILVSRILNDIPLAKLLQARDEVKSFRELNFIANKAVANLQNDNVTLRAHNTLLREVAKAAETAWGDPARFCAAVATAKEKGAL